MIFSMPTWSFWKLRVWLSLVVKKIARAGSNVSHPKPVWLGGGWVLHRAYVILPNNSKTTTWMKKKLCKLKTYNTHFGESYNVDPFFILQSNRYKILMIQYRDKSRHNRTTESKLFQQLKVRTLFRNFVIFSFINQFKIYDTAWWCH